MAWANAICSPSEPSPAAIATAAAMISTGSDDGIMGHITALGHEPHNYINVYAQVPKLEESIAKAEDLGGKTVIPPQEIPGMGRFAWIADVEGTTFGLWESL